MSSIPLIAAARHGRAFPALIVLLFASSPALYSQRPIRDQDILQYLNQTITWYHDISAVVQSPADSRQLVYADSLRQSSSEVARLAFDFARLQTSIPAASTPENLTPEGTRSRTLAQSAAAAEQRAEQARLEIEQLNRQLQT